MKGGRAGPVHPRSPFILLPSAFCLLLFLPGCAHYEYDIVEPPEAAGHVPERQWVSLQRDGLEYRLRSYENRLVMHIHNRGGSTVKLVGADSIALDPRGESHPMYSATIPPGSFISRIFPPPRPQVERYGPTVGVGVGASYGAAHGPYGYPYHDPFYYEDFGPRYYSIYDPNDHSYFDWPAETSVRLMFAYQREGGEQLRHEFLVRKRKM